MTDVEKLRAAIVAAKLTQRPPPIETVVERNGIAIFLDKDGRTIGGMNWEQYQELLKELADREGQTG